MNKYFEAILIVRLEIVCKWRVHPIKVWFILLYVNFNENNFKDFLGCHDIFITITIMNRLQMHFRLWKRWYNASLYPDYSHKIMSMLHVASIATSIILFIIINNNKGEIK